MVYYYFLCSSMVYVCMFNPRLSTWGTLIYFIFFNIFFSFLGLDLILWDGKLPALIILTVLHLKRPAPIRCNGLCFKSRRTWQFWDEEMATRKKNSAKKFHYFCHSVDPWWDPSVELFWNTRSKLLPHCLVRKKLVQLSFITPTKWAKLFCTSNDHCKSVSLNF